MGCSVSAKNKDGERRDRHISGLNWTAAWRTHHQTETLSLSKLSQHACMSAGIHSHPALREQSLPQRCWLCSSTPFLPLVSCKRLPIRCKPSISASLPPLPAPCCQAVQQIKVLRLLLCLSLSSWLPLWLEGDPLLSVLLGTHRGVLADVQTHCLASRQLKKPETICTSWASAPVFTTDAIPDVVDGNIAGRKLKESDSSYLFPWNISSLSYAKDRTEAE